MNLYQMRNTRNKGVGVFAKQFIQAGKTIALINQDQFVTCDNLSDFYQFFQLQYNPNLCNKVLFAYFLAALSVIEPHHRQENRHIIKYINQLPKHIHCLILWTQTQLRQLKNKNLLQKIRQKKQKIKISYEMIRQAVDKVWKNPLQKCQYRLFSNYQQTYKIQFNSVEKFYSFIQSRGVFHVSNRDLTGQIGALVPIIDKLNHSNNPNCTVQDKNNLIIKSLRDISPGEELLVKYGNFNTDQFLQYYGFIPQWQDPQEPQSGNYRKKLAEFYRQKIYKQEKEHQTDDEVWKKIKKSLHQSNRYEYDYKEKNKNE